MRLVSRVQTGSDWGQGGDCFSHPLIDLVITKDREALLDYPDRCHRHELGFGSHTVEGPEVFGKTLTPSEMFSSHDFLS